MAIGLTGGPTRLGNAARKARRLAAGGITMSDKGQATTSTLPGQELGVQGGLTLLGQPSSTLPTGTPAPFATTMGQPTTTPPPKRLGNAARKARRESEGNVITTPGFATPTAPPSSGGPITTLPATPPSRPRRERARGPFDRGSGLNILLKDLQSNPQDPAKVAQFNAAVSNYYASKGQQRNTTNYRGVTGGSTVSEDPRTGERTVSDTLSDTEQGIYEGEAGVNQEIFDQILSKLQAFEGRGEFSTDSLGQAPSADAFGNERRRIENETYQGLASRLEPQIQQERERLMSELANRGVPVGSELYNKQLKDFDQRAADSRLDAQRESIGIGGNEFSRNFDASLRGRQQGFSELERSRAIPLNEITQLLGRTRGAIMPRTATPGAYQPPQNQYGNDYYRGREFELSQEKLRQDKELAGAELGNRIAAIREQLAGQLTLEDLRADRRIQEILAAQPSLEDSLYAIGGDALGAGLGEFFKGL